METTMKISVVTTFHERGLQEYGQRMIETFCTNWPAEVKLHIYPEMCNPAIRYHNHVTLKRLEEISELMAFKNRWKDVPKANGDVSKDPIRSKRKDGHLIPSGYFDLSVPLRTGTEHYEGGGYSKKKKGRIRIRV
jgi:hypothetical protein